MRKAVSLFIGIALLIAGFQFAADKAEIRLVKGSFLRNAPQGVCSLQEGARPQQAAPGRYLRSGRAEERTGDSTGQIEAGASAKPEAGRWSRAEVIAFFAVAGILLLWAIFICGTLLRSNEHLENTMDHPSGSDWEDPDEGE